MVKVYDSEITDRGTLRKFIYCKGVFLHKEAKRIALRDIAIEKANNNNEKEIKPYKEPNYNREEMYVYLERWKLLQPKSEFTEWLKNERRKYKEFNLI
jgi:CHAD domain-containing protein